MTITEALLTHPWYGYPYTGNLRRHQAHVIAVVHQTSVAGYDGQAMVLRNQRDTATKPGNTSTYYVDPDGDAVHAVDGTRFASWGACPDDYSHFDLTRASVALVLEHHNAYGVNPNECAWEQIECCGTGPEPWTDAQFATSATIIAARARLSGLPINRDTVLPHRDWDTDDRPDDPWPADRREERMARLIKEAQAMAGDPADMENAKAAFTRDSDRFFAAIIDEATYRWNVNAWMEKAIAGWKANGSVAVPVPPEPTAHTVTITVTSTDPIKLG